MIHVRLVKEYSPLQAGGIAPEDFQRQLYTVCYKKLCIRTLVSIGEASIVHIILSTRCFMPAATAVPAVLFKLTRGGCFSRAANAVPLRFVEFNNSNSKLGSKTVQVNKNNLHLHVWLFPTDDKMMS
ncbi:hypothetical protein T03_7078 [Trichinella britovi]|uniref:Uncharacterized protein n=1 Tax=Trichinella britovi TaxID=45882 RepID=A0A0V1CV30_TRIBR|nr:hypothetical protein T03_7078 [Trichinella britovi]